MFDYWKQVSFDSIDLKGSEVFGWYKLSFTAEQIKKWADRQTIIQEAKKVAIKNGINLSTFKHSLVIITEFKNSGGAGNDVVLGMVDRPGQSNWRWCKKCQGLAFWDGSRKPGPCPTGPGERHEHLESSLYSLMHDKKIGGQNNWRWCSKCEGLVHGSLVGKCPGGGNHELKTSSDYVLYTGPISGAQEQWYKCKKCQGLAYGGSSTPGTCPSGGVHEVITDDNFKILFEETLSVGFCAHETGHGFGFDHSFDVSREGDIYNDPRPGAYRDKFDIMSYANTTNYSPPRYSPIGPSLNAPTLYKLGWIQDNRVWSYVIGSHATSDILLLSLGSTLTSGYKMVRIIDPTRSRIYTLEYRTPTKWDTGIGLKMVVIHELRTFYTIGQNLWRWCKNCEGMIYAGHSPCSSGGVHDYSASGEYILKHDVPSSYRSK